MREGRAKQKTFMKKGTTFLFIFLFLFSISLNLVEAQPPPQTNINIDVGLEVEFTKIGILENGEDHLFNAHVFNISNQLRVDNTTTDCNFHLFDNKGDHIINQAEMTYDSFGLDWELDALGGNFTRNGEYSFLIICNTTNVGGFISVGFDVTQTGTFLQTSQSLLYIVILIATFLLFLAFLYPAVILPYSNMTNPDGSITRITKSKYLKLLSIWFSYGFLMWFLQTLNGISTSFIQLTFLSNFITNVFTYSWGISVGVTFLILSILFIEAWKDIILSDTIKKFGKAFPGKLQ